ncbi:MAG: exopolysaccharide biosynthesis polyprenyl glycosylphosphotransferase [Pseudomonadota bacterium]
MNVFSIEPQPASSPASPGLGEDAKMVAAALRRPAVSAASPAMFARFLDLLALTLAFWFTEFAASGGALDPLRTALLATGTGGLGVLIVGQMGGYTASRMRRFAPGAVLAWGSGFGLAALTGAAGLWSTGWESFLPASALALAVAILPARICSTSVAHWVLDFGLTERRAVVAGGGENVARLVQGLAANPKNDIRICGIFDDRYDGRSPAVVSGIPKLGRMTDLVEFTRLAELDMLIVALPLDAEARIRQILDEVRILPIDVRLSNYSDNFVFPRRLDFAISEPGLIDISDRPLAGGRRLAKRALDIALTCAALLPLLPLMAVTALAIRLESPGPVIFRQMRDGYNHKPVEIFKFRSMFAEQSDPEARKIVTRGDPRVTRVGQIIRKWSIDELPQLFNVLRGDLSLVGPRPHAVNAISSRQEAFEDIVDGYAARHRVPPGVTGWAQIHGLRGEIDDPATLLQRVEHDLYYIENRSLWLDLYILAMTPLKLLDTRNAY